MNFIFDLYGTLADIRTDENSVKFKNYCQKLFAKLNPRVDFRAEYNRLCALKTEAGGEYCEIDLYSVFREIAGSGVPEKELEKAVTLFRKKSRSRLKLYRGVKPLIKKLKRGGAKLYILSNAQACFTLKEIEKLKIQKYFDGIELSSCFGEKKPSPRFFRYVMEKYELEPAKTFYTGNDICADIVGAREAGLKTAYILSNISPAEDSLERAREVADFATDDLKELSAFLLSV